MTEPAVLALEVQSYLFDSIHLRDRWPRLQSACVCCKAAVTTVGSSLGTSDHIYIYWVMPIIKATRAFSKPKSTLRQAKDVNYADRSCWNGWSSLPHCTFHQRRDDTWSGAIITSGKLLEARSLPMMCFSTYTQDIADPF